MSKNFKEVLKDLNDELEKHTPSNGNYTGIQKTNDGGQEGSGEGSAPRGGSAKITQANKVAARSNSSAKTPTSSRATFEHVHRTPGSEAKPLSQIKPVPHSRPGLIPMIAPKIPQRK